jgi:hypothetical protein
MKNPRQRLAVCLASTALALAWAAPAWATTYFDGQRGEIQARISTQNTFQHDGVDTFDWVQWRNEVRFDLKYDLIPVGKTYGILEGAKLNLLYRGRYDAVYDIRDSFDRHGYDRDDFRFPEGKYPRELFLDLAFTGPLKNFSARIGRQQVVWGESDLFRSLDVVNPLRVDQNGFVGEDFADYREPLWIAKFLYNLENIGILEGAGLEVFYSPDSRPQADRFNLILPGTYRIGEDTRNVLDGFQTSTMLPWQQVRSPWEIVRVGGIQGVTRNVFVMDAPATVQNADGSFSDFIYQIRSDTPRSEVDADRSMVGVRLLGNTFGNAYVTLNYLFKRSDRGQSLIAFHEIFDKNQPGTGAIRGDILNEAVVAALSPDNNGNFIPDLQEQQIRDCISGRSPELIIAPQAFGRTDIPLSQWHGSVRSVPGNPNLDTGAFSTACLSVPRKHPWTHILGFTLTYNDYDYTGFVWRLEQSFSTKEPSQGTSPAHPKRLRGCLDNDPTTVCDGVPRARDFSTMNARFYEVWRSMVGFDYLRSINASLGMKMRNPLLRSLLVDQWFFTFQFLNEYLSHVTNHNEAAVSLYDRTQHWNPLLTFSMTGFFLNNRFRPTLSAGYEVNQSFPLFITQFDYYMTPRISFRVGEIVYAGSSRVMDRNFLAYYADRDTTYFRVIYYLL